MVISKASLMFNEQYKISIRDINYGQHLDHLAMLGYLHETRVRYFKSIGGSEIDIDGNNSALIVINLKCDYKKECFYGDIINVQLELFKMSEMRLILKYIVTRNSEIVATAEIIAAFMNRDRKLIKVPASITTPSIGMFNAI
jgi:4-hydroxybenzoyl-CoA thioesterase